VTTYRSPPDLGLTVTDTDVAPPGSDAFVREYWVARSPDSPVTSASLVYFENFNPIASHIPFLPITDWCTSEISDQRASYDPAAHAIVNSWAGIDAATARPASIAVAFGFAGADSAHQVGEDGYEKAALPGGPPDPYDELSKAPHTLTGDGSARGQTTGALEQPLRFEGGVAEARMTIAGGANGDAALAALQATRDVPFPDTMASEDADWRGFLAQTKLPDGGGPRVEDVAKRSLITVRLARDPASGSIVASANTQGPYGEDWIRDGAFINRVLDQNGYTAMVTQHDLFYARVQTSLTNLSLVRPPGNWAMNYYDDGIDGGPIPWEIDETGLGAWTLYDHYLFLGGQDAADYLAQVYPAIARAATFLTRCKDPTTGLQCIANEDDNPTPSQSLHGAGPVYLGLESAIAAAQATGDHSRRTRAWQHRLDQLRQAIDDLYDPATQSYSSGGAGNAYNVEYGDGGWLLWPVQFRPYDDPTMVGEANAVYRSMRQSLASPRGQYEAKGLLGLAYAWQPLSPEHFGELDATLRYLAGALTTPTGLFGESWIRTAAGKPIPVQDMPHVWEHSLFYLAALEVEGSRPYSFAGQDAYSQACAGGTAPASACP
jgi:hypothetical protein